MFQRIIGNFYQKTTCNLGFGYQTLGNIKSQFAFHNKSEDDITIKNIKTAPIFFE
jgi:hypothetical protein